MKIRLTLVSINHRSYFLMLPHIGGKAILSVYTLSQLGFGPGTIIVG